MLSAFGKIFKRDRAVLPPSEERPLMRVLEPRILLDAAGMETARDMADQSEDSTAAMVDALAPEDFIDGTARDLSRDIVFIDGEVENIGELLGELDPDVEIHILDLHEDGVEQIADILEGREDILAVHIFSHGGQGFLNLGSSQLSLETMSSTHADALNRIGDALSEEGDILVYGCDFASGEVGKVAAQALARATGADIAASNDVTGAADLGGDWDLEVVQGDVETQALEVEGFKGVLGAFELGTVDPPTVTYVNEFTPAGAPQFGSVGETGTVAIWENAGTVDTGTEVISVDVRATVVSVTNASEIFVGFGTRDDDEGDNDDATIDDFRVYVHNTSAVAGGSNSGNIGSATIVWEVFKTGTNQTERADIGEVSLTTADIDGTAAGTTTTRETLAAALSDLSSYTVQAGTNLEVSNDGVNLRATGTADQDSEESSWVQYSWNSINQLTMIYESRTPYAYFNHDGDGDLVFTNPETSFATGIDLDMNDSSGATGSNYQTIFYSNATSGTPVAIADGDIMVTNEAGSATSATITLTNALAGDLLNVDTVVLASLGLTGSVDTSIAGEITVTLAGNASATDYQTAIQSITFENTNYGSIDTTPRSIDVQVFDGAFASGIANTAVTFGTIINQPTANHDVYVGQEDTGLSVTGANSLLSNDDDPNGAALSVRSATDGAGNPIAVNAVGTLTPVSHTMPTGAVITLYDDGTFDYVPPADYSGVEFFNYTVENTGGFVGQSYASINIQGVADTPVVTNGLISAAADEDTASGTLDLTATQGDADGSESLRYSVSLIPTGYTITDGVRSFTSNGTSDIAYLDGWDLTTISLVPPTPDQHSDLDVAVQLTVEASEPNGSSTSASDTVTFRFDAVADAPTLTVTSGGAGPGALLNVSPLVSATLTDIDGSEEIVSYEFSNIPAGATFYVGTTPQSPVGGVVTIAAADFAALRLEVPNTVGNYSVDVMAVSSEVNAENQISQLTANSTVETLNFTVDNIDDPVTANDDNYTVFGGQTVVLNPLGNDLVPDGGPVITQVDGQTISAGQTRTLASGAGDVTLNADGTLTFVAAAGFSGQDTFTYVVEDADGSTDTANITLDAPTWSIVGDASVGEGGSASYTITLDATPPMGTPVSVDISAINVDTTLADYGDLAAAIQTAADASSYFTFDGTTLTYAADYESAQVAGSNFQDVSSDPSATALGIGLFDPTRVGLGFDFDFYGETYSDIYVSDFGILTFGGGSAGGGGAYNNTSFAAGNTLGGLPAIAPFWDIIGMDRTNSDEVYTLTQGLPGEREFIVQFNDVVIYFNDTAGETITFQAVLREGSNEIEFRYDDVTMTNTTYSLGASATVGLSDGSGTRFEEFSFATASLSDNTRIVFSAENVAASKSLTFSLGANADGTFEGPEDYSISLSNADGSAVSATSGAATTTITDVNQAPSNTVPVTSGTAIPATTVDEDSALVFNAGNGNAIVVDDPDGDSLTVTLSVTNGTLIAATVSGATIGGDGTATLTLSGTQAQVNAALDGLSYIGIGDFNGTDQLTISTNDNGGQLNSVTVSTVDLAVTAVDDIVSNSAAIISGNTVTIDVLGNDSFEGTVTNVSATNGANGTVVVNGDNTITYTWTGAASSGLDSFTYTVTSGGVTETSNVMIILQTPTAAVNDSNATDEDTVLNVTSGGVLTNDYGSAPTPALDYNTIDVSGAPNGSWSSGVAGLDLTWSGGITQNNSPTTAYPGLTESLVFDGSGGATSVSLQDISGNPSDADASFEIWFKYDPADYASGLGAVLYETGGGTDGMSIALSDSTGSGGGTIDHLLVQFNDGGNTIVELIDLEAVLGVGNISNEFINVSAVYDKDASGGDDEVRLYVNGILLATQTTTGLNDWAGSSGSGLGTTSNNANIGSAQFGNFTGEIAGLKFTEAALTDAEVKSRFDSVAGLSVVSHDVTSSLGATVVVNADGSYSYDPTSASALQAMQAGDSLADSFTYTISDANGTLSMATVNLTVAGVNDAPAGTDITVALAEDSSHVLSVADFGFDDPVDGTNDNFANVVFATVPADGDLIYDDGVAPSFTIIAGQTISTADIAAGYVTFVPDADANNTQTAGADYASFQFQVVDDGGTASGGVDTDQSPNTFTFSVTPVDDAVAHNVPGAQTATEDTPLAITGVSVVDVDGDALTTIVSIPASSGTLNVTTGTGAGLSGDGSGTVTLTGTAVQINAALAGLTYTPADDFNTDGAGPFNLTITSDDGGLPVFNTVSIAVDPVTDIVGDTVSTAEDTTLTFDAIGGAFGADNFESGSAAVTAVTQGANGTVSINGSGEIVYVPDANFNGVDSFSYTVTSGGVTETATVSVTITPVNDGPTLVDDTATGAEDGVAIIGDVLANDSDVDFDGLTVVSYVVSGVAGTHAADATTSIPGVGDITLNSDGSFSFAPDADYNGSVPQITYTATDGTATATAYLDITVTPVDDAVAHNVPGAQTATEDTPLAITGVSVVDVDGDALTTIVSIPASSGTLNVTTGTGAGLSGDGSGTVTLTGTAVQINAALAGLTYTPADDFNTDGAGPFNLTITSDDGGLPVFNTVSIAVDPVTDIVGDTVSTAEDTTLTFDAIGGAFGADNFESGSAAVTAVTQGANGTVSINGSGEIVYVPDANFNGVDSFSYTVTSGGVTETATVSVTITPVNDGPTLVDDTATGAEDGVAIIGDVLANDSDVDFDGLTVVSYVVSGVAGTHAADATTSIPGVGDITLNSDGSFSFAPDADYNGSVPQITYTATDGTATATAYLDITVTPVDDAVAHNVPGAQTATEDTPLAITGVSVVDVDGDALTTIVSIPASSGTLNVTTGTGAGLSGDGSGTVTLTGTAVQINAALAGLTYTPADDFNTDGAGPFNLTITSDDGGLPVFNTVSIAVDPVTDIVGDTVSTAEDTTLTFDAIGGAFGADNFESGSAAVTAVTQGANGTVSINGSGEIVYVPDANFNGVDSFSYTVTSGGVTETATVSVTITPVNDGPTLVDDTATGAEDGVAIIGDVLANDSDVDFDGLTVVSYVVSGVAGTHAADATTSIPGVGDITLNSDGSFSFAPDADYNGSVPQITYTATDGTATATAYLDITVTPVDDAVAHNVPGAQTATEDTPLAITGVSVVDVDGDALTTIVSIPASSGTLNVTTGTGAGLSGDGSGTVTLTGTAVQINAALAGLTYTPADDFNTDGAGPFNLTITSDDGGLPVFNTVSIAVDPVTDIVGDTVSTAEDTTLTFDAIGGAFGADNFESGSAAVTAVTQGANGTVSINGSGEIVYVPDANFNGVDSFSYTVTSGGVTETATVSVTITPVNDGPTLVDDTATGAEDGVAIIGDVLANDSDVDFDGLTVVSYVVSGVAGTHAADATTSIPGVGDITLNSDGSFSFAPDADYNGSVPQITYTATDGTATATAYLDITVTPVDDAPVAAGDVATTAEDVTLVVDAASGVLSNDHDGDGGALGTGVNVTEFDVGGFTYTAGATANLTEGDLTLNGDGSYTFAPASNYHGPIPQVTYTVSDGVLTDTSTLNITVTPENDAPVVTAPAGTVNGTEDTGLVFSVIGGNAISIGDIDIASGDPGTTSVTLSVDHGTLTASPGSGAGVVGDGTDTVVLNGTVAQVNAALDGLLYTGVADFHGGDLISVSVDDGTGSANAITAGSVLINVTAVADIVDDAVSTNEDTAVGFNVLTGLTAGNPDGASADGFLSSTPILAGIGAGPDAPQNGVVSISPDGSIVYTPNADFHGVDSFSYTIETPDGDGGVVSETGTVTITVNPVNDTPVQTVPDTSGGPIAATTTTEDGTITFTAANGNSLSVADVDGPNLSTVISVTYGVLTPASGSGATITTAGTGSVTISGTAAQINAALDGLVYTPNDDFNTDGVQSESMVMTTDDGSGAGNAITTDTVALGITGVADAVNDAISTNEDTVAAFNVLTGLTAGLADGASADNFENAGHTVTGVTQGTYGSVSFDAAGNVTYTPQTNYNVSVGGFDTFTYTVTTDDGQGGAITETATVSVTVISVNDSPDAVGNAYIGPEDVAITGNLITDDTSGTAGSESGVDSDVETLLGGLTIASFTVAGTTGPNPDSSWPAGTSATATGFGTLTVNGDGTFNLVPSANYVGAFPAVTYTLDDGSGAAPGANGPTDTAPVVFTFTAVNDDPTASGLNPTTAEDVAVSGTITMNDPDLPSGPDVLTASLDSGPGSAPNNGSVVVNSDGSYTYTPDPDFNGIDTFTVYVEDGQGGSTTTTITVTVTPVNDAPVAAADAATTAEDTPLIVNAASGVLSNDHDGDGSGLGVGVTVTTFTVDGTPYAANATANLTQGALTLNDDGSYSFVPAANFNGSVPQVTYTVSDGGLTDTATLDINVTPVNDRPVASDDAYTVNEDSVIGISGNLILDDGGFGVDTDADGDSLVITAAIVDLDGNGIGDPVAFNTPLTITDNLANPIGTLTLQANGLFSFVPAADYFGTVPAITYTIDDGTGAINSSDIGVLTIAVAPVNDAPDASNDAVAGNEDQVISLNPTLPVDVDDAQSVLTVVVGQVPLASQGTLSYTPDGGGVGTVLPGQVLSMTELTSVTFLSALNYNGSVDNFTYQAMDDEGETDAGSIGSVAITLTAVNDAPTAVNDGPVAVTEDVAVSGNVLTNDSDIDGDSITVVDFTVAGVPGPVAADSMATIPGVGTLVINTNGSFTFTPATNYNGAVPAISYTISDGNGLTDTANLSFADVTPVNDDPNATANSYSVSEDTNLAGNLLLDDTGAGLDFDLDGDGISVSGFSVLGETGPFLLGTPLTIAGVGELTVLSNGNFSFDPATNYNGGVPQITYSITDGVGGSASAVVDITVDPVNDAPTVTSPTITTAEDQVAVGAVTIADVDGDVPVASLDTAPVNGTAVVNPDGTWSYTPSADFHGTDQFDILVDDLNGGTASVTVFVTITPVADVADDQIVTPEDTPISFNVLTGSGTVGGVGGPGADTFEGSPVVTSVTHGSHGSVTFNAAGDVVYTPDPNYNGPDSFTYTVVSGGLSETATVTVNVSPVNDLPTGVSTPATTLEDTPVSGSIAMTDIDGDTVTASAGPDPDHGSVTVNPDGTWTYVPDADFEGTDSFTIIIDDGNGGTNTVLVDITVIPVNDAPVAVSTTVEISGTDPVSVSIPLPTDVDDVSAVLLSTIQQVPDPSAGSLTYLPGGVSGTPVQLTVGMVLTNVELSTLVYTAFNPSLGSNGTLVYQTQDDSGATDGGSIASIVFKVVAVPNNAIFDDSSFPETERKRVDETIAAEPIVPFVVDAVNEIADLGSVGDLDPNNGIVLNTVSQIVPTNATTDLVPVDPAVLDAVQAIDALRQVHLENSGSSPEMRSISTNDWGVESLTGFSLKFTHDANQEEDQGAYSDSGQLVIETYVRERILFIDVTNTFDPDVEGVVSSYRVEMADGSELPDWIRIVRDGFVIAERPANLWDLSLKISAEMEDGSLIARGVVIDGPTGEIQPLNLDGQEDGKRFEDKLRQLVNT